MTKNLLLIPTIDTTLSERCLSSVYPSLIRTNTRAIMVYNGADPGITTNRIDEYALRIGYEDAEKLTSRFAEIANCPKELLFGKPEYGRSYGGASNLMLAIAGALDSRIIAKIDDDCLDTRPPDDSWLQTAIELAGKQEAVHFGHCSGSPSGFLHELPIDTAIQLGRFLYDESKIAELLGGDIKGGSVKNGVLVFRKSAAMKACYPVLFDPNTQTHVRGEVYCWREDLKEFGLQFLYQSSLALGHYPNGREGLNRWARSSVFGFDFWFVYRFYKNELRYPSVSERRNAVSKFRSWIQSSEWPEGVDIDELVSIMDESLVLSFTDRIFREAPERGIAWRRLMNSDLANVIRGIIPKNV